MQVVTGNGLEQQIFADSIHKPRLILPELLDYLQHPASGRVSVLYGLRRTGKTTMISHAIAQSGAINQSAYILAQEKDDLDGLIGETRRLINNGVKKIFIDEATAIGDLIQNANIFSDIFAKQAHITLTGTDSLGFAIASNNTLYDRARMIHTTWIPWREHSFLLRTETIDDYIESGGILTPHRRNLFKNYTLDAIVPNILRSLKNYKNFGALESLYESGLLETAIQNIIKHDTHRFTSEVVKSEFELSDFTIAARYIENDNARKIIEKIDLRSLSDRVRQRLSIKHSNLLKGISTAQIYEINRWLYELELVAPRTTILESDIFPEVNSETLAEKLNLNGMKASARGDWILTQPGLRWAQVNALLGELEADFRNLKMIPEIGRNSEYQDAVTIIIDRIKDNARGKILEEIIFMELARKADNCDVFRYQKQTGEIDVVAASKNRKAFKLFEVKNSKRAASSHGRHMRDPETVEALENVFGKLAHRGVIYRGAPMAAHGCEYQNCADFLNNLEAATNMNQTDMKAPGTGAAAKKRAGVHRRMR